MPTQAAQGNQPVHTVRHRGLKATVWRNQTEKGPMYNVTLVRSYRDRASGEWHDTASFGYDDLMNLSALMYEAHSYYLRTSRFRFREFQDCDTAAEALSKANPCMGQTSRLAFFICLPPRGACASSKTVADFSQRRSLSRFPRKQ
jgi:hypothetical protein